MKRLITLVALLLLAVCVSFSQTRVYTESQYNLYKHYSAATAANGDTVVNVIGAQAGFSTGNTVLPYLVGIVINKPVANDVLTVLDGGTTVSIITLAAAPVLSPVFVKYDAKLGTCLVYKQTSTSDVTLVYRTWR